MVGVVVVVRQSGIGSSCLGFRSGVRRFVVVLVVGCTFVVRRGLSSGGGLVFVGGVVVDAVWRWQWQGRGGLVVVGL